MVDEVSWYFPKKMGTPTLREGNGEIERERAGELNKSFDDSQTIPRSGLNWKILDAQKRPWKTKINIINWFPTKTSQNAKSR